MGIFDGVFNTDPQQRAAADQIAGINAGYGQLSDLFGAGRTAASNTFNNGVNALYGNTAVGNAALGTNFGRAGADLSGAFGAGRGAVTDALGGANTTLGGTYGQARDALTSNYYSGIAPFLQNYATAASGNRALSDALGLNGPEGNARAKEAFTNNPGYQFGLDQGEAAIAAQAQKSGMGASGNALMDASKFATNYANQNWNNYIDRLSPYLSASDAAARGIQSGYGSLAGGLGANYQSLGNILSGNTLQTGRDLLGNYQALGAGLSGIDTGLGTGLNTNALTLGQGINANQIGLGTLLNSSYGTQGNAAYGAATSAGNARANADLAQAQANANIWGAIGGAAKGIVSML